MRRKRDSNPRYTLGVYTLSRRASSTTRASLQNVRKIRKKNHFQIFQTTNLCFLLHIYTILPEINLGMIVFLTYFSPHGSNRVNIFRISFNNH